LVKTVDNLWRLFHLLVEDLDSGEVATIRPVLLEFDLIIDQEVHKSLFFFWG
jgi:hypothetical protein